MPVDGGAAIVRGGGFRQTSRDGTVARDLRNRGSDNDPASLCVDSEATGLGCSHRVVAIANPAHSDYVARTTRRRVDAGPAHGHAMRADGADRFHRRCIVYLRSEERPVGIDLSHLWDTLGIK